MEERIKNIYNDCWINYKMYLSNHDMKEYNKRSMKLKEKYGGKEDVINLLFWFAPIVNELHDAWRKNNG